MVKIVNGDILQATEDIICHQVIHAAHILRQQGRYQAYANDDGRNKWNTALILTLL